MEQNIPPKKWKIAFLVWCAIYPLITLLFFVLGPYMETWPFFMRTLLLTLILVPFMVFMALPFILRRFGSWLRK